MDTILIVYILFFSFLSDIQREEEKVKRSIKDAAKKGQKDVCVVLAKEMIQSKRAVTKLYASKAHMNSIQLSMKNQLCEFLCCCTIGVITVSCRYRFCLAYRVKCLYVHVYSVTACRRIPSEEH